MSNVTHIRIPALQPGRVNPDIQIKWVTFSPGHAGCRVRLKNPGL